MKKVIDPSKLIDIDLTVPDREPYEAKATQKQKSWLWHHGLDTDDIDKLGRNQASSVIEQMKQMMRTKEQKERGIGCLAMIAGSAVVVTLLILWNVYFRK